MYDESEARFESTRLCDNAPIFAAAERLSSFPYSGRIVPQMDEPQIREIIVGLFCVVYRVGDELIEVATVFRASRSFPGKF